MGGPLQSTLQPVPELLDRVKARCLRIPVQFLDSIVIIPGQDGPRNMTGDIVIQKVTCVHPVKLPQCRKPMVIQIRLGVESTRHFNQVSRAIARETPLQHYSTFAELHSWHNAFWQEAFSGQTPNPDRAIRMVEGEP